MKDQINHDKRIVVTLDAGGTNCVFGAIQDYQFIVKPVIKPSNANVLEKCLETLVEGFTEVIRQLPESPVAISFAFPGTIDYSNGIICGYLPNFPSFRGGVALADFLYEKLKLPVFINNDADLFTYGEAIAGVLPEINQRLEAIGSVKRYRNLIGFTFGTGFGFGISINGNMYRGDNSCLEIFCLPHKHLQNIIVEDGVSIRAVKRVYGELTGESLHDLEPVDICQIAEGVKSGNREAAQQAFAILGEVAGNVIATCASLLDGLIVIGGGLTKAEKYFMPALLKEIRSNFSTISGEPVARVQSYVYNLQNEEEFLQFAKGDQQTLKVFNSEKEVIFDPQKRIGITISKLGAEIATSLGAYAFALRNMNTNRRNVQTVPVPHIAGLRVIQPNIIHDERGYFFESYNHKTLKSLGIEDVFVQDNQSCSKKNVIRGLHFQVPPFAQAKLVHVLKGAVLDLAVDIRKESPTYGQHFSILLSEENQLQLYIPEGFAHGFAALEENTVFAYKCSKNYHKDSERALLFNDKDLNINWNIETPIVSDKDLQAMRFADFVSPF
jgi:dTDP-4-dehydrorhamnose 3,5-epimerase